MGILKIKCCKCSVSFYCIKCSYKHSHCSQESCYCPECLKKRGWKGEPYINRRFYTLKEAVIGVMLL